MLEVMVNQEAVVTFTRMWHFCDMLVVMMTQKVVVTIIINVESPVTFLWS